MYILTDFHHGSLLQSLILLFEKRLGGEVYRPIGREWFDQGYWKVYDHPATVEQFLGIGGNTPDGTAKLNEVVAHPAPDIYKCHDIDSGTDNKAITIKGFFDRHFDIVIASIPQHVEPFKKLCATHKDHPKLIYQIGNAWTTEAAMAPNIMASAIINDVPREINFISYHQEFDTEIFYPSFPPIYEKHGNLILTCLCIPLGKNIYSFVNCFDTAEHFANDWLLFQQVEKEMADWTFKVHGGQCRDGAIGPTHKLADKMREARFIWHVKAGGDGYGHVLHNALAVGRPLIVKKSYYIGKLAEPLLIDGVTCIDIDGLSYPQIIDKIVYNSEPGRYFAMCKAAYDNFCRVVYFDKEHKNIEIFFSKLL